MGSPCNTHHKKSPDKTTKYRFCADFGETDHLENPSVDGRIILRWIFWKWDGGMYWINLAQDRDGWWAVVNMGMNLWIP